MKRWGRRSTTKAGKPSVVAARSLVPSTVLRSAEVLDIGDSLEGYELGPARQAFPILGFSGAITYLHSYETGRFDVVAMLDKAERFTFLELQTIAAQAHRVLRDGGHFVLTWDTAWYHRAKGAVGRLRRAPRPRYPRTKREMAAALKAAGFLFGGCGTWALGRKHWAWVMK